LARDARNGGGNEARFQEVALPTLQDPPTVRALRKFEDHVDTLLKKNRVETVVLSLPSEHVGRILSIRHHGETMELDSAKVEGGFGTELSSIDCTHSVQEVMSGWRVVVQYDVYEEGGDASGNVESVGEKGDKKDRSDDEESGNEDIASRNDNRRTVERVVECFENYNRCVGTSKIHNKEQTELTQYVLQYMTKIPPTQGVARAERRIALLKGADRIIYDAFSKRGGLSIPIQGVLVYVQTEYMSQVSFYIAAVSMKDFLPASSGNDDNDQRSTDTDATDCDD
jgi:hypothetical protein